MGNLRLTKHHPLLYNDCEVMNAVLSENYLVKKTTPLIYAEWSTLGVNEMKIVEVYLSRLDIKNGKTTVKFTKKEFANLMGYVDSRNLKTKVFDERLAKFMSQQIRIDLDDGNGYHRFILFSDAKCYYDENVGMSVVEIDCNPKLAPVFLDLADGKKNGGYKYISYRVERTRKMESAYSIRLYNLLLDHCFGSYQWVVDINELRNLLGATASSYESYKYFNATLLKKAQKEINELTDISFDYDRMTKGRKTTGVIFKITKKKEYKNEDRSDEVLGEAKDVTDVVEPEMEGQTTIFDFGGSYERDMTDKDVVDFISDELKNYKTNKWKLTKNQMIELGNIVYKHIYQVEENFDNLPSYKRELTWMNFIIDMLKKASEEKAKNLYPYLISQWDRYAAEIVTRNS